jgi:alpha-N-arabinofuranosidase
MHGRVPWLESVATYDADAGTATLFAVNRSVDEPIELLANVRALGEAHLVGATTLYDSDIRAHNTEETPDRVVPRPLTDITAEEGVVRALLPPVSWSVIRLIKSPSGAPAVTPNPKE